MRKIFIPATLCAVLGFWAPASAQQTTHSGVTEIDLTNFIGTVNIETASAGSVSLTRNMGANADYPVFVEAKDGVLTIHSNEDPDDIDWWDDVDWRHHKENAFKVFLEDYPTLTFRIPEGTALDFDSAVILLTAGDTRGSLSVREGHVTGAIGDLASADIAIHGSGDIKIGAIEGAFHTNIHGSGDLDAKSAGSLDADIHGSGDITVGRIAKGAVMSIHGSGDINLGDVGGPLKLSINGSGDVETGAVAGGADIGVNGSGDVTLASVNGKTAARLRGSGDIEIRGGRAENLMVDIRGSGSFDHRGVATNPNVYAGHSGDIHIARHEGTINARGGGDIKISGADYGDDD
jgi:hypothetical protein